MAVTEEGIPAQRGTLEADDEPASPGRKGWAQVTPPRMQEIEGFGTQGVPGKFHRVDPVVHGDELHSVSGMDLQTLGEDMLLGSSSPQDHPMKQRTASKPQGPGTFQARIGGRPLPGLAPEDCQKKEEE